MSDEFDPAFGNLFRDVAEFHRKFGMAAFNKPGLAKRSLMIERCDCLEEELLELREAVQYQDLALQADALVDLVYFAIGTAVILGIPFQRIWDEVHKANMAKVPGVTHRGHAVDVTKPEGWKPPEVRSILEQFGFDATEQCDLFGVHEDLCRDHNSC